MNEFKIGMRVTITDKLEGSKTESLHKLDRTGNMLKMQGNSYIVTSVTSRYIKVGCPDAGRAFSFNEEDVTHYNEILPPNEFKFNENLLDV
jgi:hypothetical protein